MKFVLTAGGTAGHINPAIALGEELISRGHQVYFSGCSNRLESKLIPQEGFEFKAFNAVGFNRKHPLTLIKALYTLQKSTKLAKDWLKEIKPDAVVGFGCYVSLSVCRAALQLKIPTYIHEQNSVMGMANKYLCKRANATCLTYKHADTGNCKKLIITGNPVRKKFFETTREEGKKFLGIPNNAKVLLVFGGSLGAKRLNEEIYKLKDELLKRKDLYIVHITGKNSNISSSSRYIVFEYQNNMAETMAAADMCISRAGASSLAEITAMTLPALLIPYPHATENHQFYNSESLVKNGCAMSILDKEIDSIKFKQMVLKLVDDENARNNMVSSLKKLDAANAVNKLADVIC